jgi:hypothetical protein
MQPDFSEAIGIVRGAALIASSAFAESVKQIRRDIRCLVKTTADVPLRFRRGPTSGVARSTLQRVGAAPRGASRVWGRPGARRREPSTQGLVLMLGAGASRLVTQRDDFVRESPRIAERASRLCHGVV